jgi:hypothetical protein
MQKPDSTRAALFALLGLLAVGNAAWADELPNLRPGLWQFERSAAGQKMHTTQCTSPNQDMKRQNEMIEKRGGCKMSPLKRSGNTYTFSADCTLSSPQGPVTFRSTSAMTVESDSAYKIEVTTSDALGPTGKELLTARRIGDCANPK